MFPVPRGLLSGTSFFLWGRQTARFPRPLRRHALGSADRADSSATDSFARIAFTHHVSLWQQLCVGQSHRRAGASPFSALLEPLMIADWLPIRIPEDHGERPQSPVAESPASPVASEEPFFF